MKLRKSKNGELTHVVSVAVLKDGKLLMGLRGDTGKWNLPGGHVEGDEALVDAAKRELLEETGLKASGGVYRVGWCEVRPGLRVHTFFCETEGEPDASADPDEEMVAFKWVTTSKFPKAILNNLYNKKDVSLQFLGIQEESCELIWDEDGMGDREGAREIRGLLKSEEVDLEKGAMSRLAPGFDPGKIDPADRRNLANWQEGAVPEARDALPAMDANARMRALHHLSAKTQVRKDANGQREFLLHRGMGADEISRAKSPTGDYCNHDKVTSWTPKKNTARLFAMNYGDDDKYKNVISAWVHEKFIRTIPVQLGSHQVGRARNELRPEHEVVVEPYHDSEIAVNDPAAENKKEIDNRINVRAANAPVRKAEEDLVKYEQEVGDWLEKMARVGTGATPPDEPKPKEGKVEHVDPASEAQPKLHPTETPEFKNWFGQSKAVHPETQKPLKVFHGTTHDFNAFSNVKGNPENYFGRAHYFTDSTEDVGANYASETGPDLTNRIASETERLENDDPDLEPEEHEQTARSRLVGPAPRTIPAYLKMENPVVLHPKMGKGTWFEQNEEVDDDGEPTGNVTGNAGPLIESIRRTSAQYGLDGDEILGHLMENAPFYDGVSADYIDHALRNNESLMDLQDEEGNNAHNEFLRDIWRNAGHDGIIMNASRFGNMKGTQGTNHYIVFEPHQIKSAIGNSGAFDPQDPDFIKEEMSALEKMARPGPKFPGLGLPDDRRETPIVTNPRQLEVKNRAIINNVMRGSLYNPVKPNATPLNHPEGDSAEHTEEVWDDVKTNNRGAQDMVRRGALQAPTSNGAASVTGQMASYAKGTKLRPPQGNLGDVAQRHPTAPGATQLHEDLHLMMNRVQGKYGMEGRRNLVSNLLNDLKLHLPKAHNTLKDFIKVRYPSAIGDSIFGGEEHLSTMLNYLNNPGEREAFHLHMGHDDDVVREFGNQMKQAYAHVTARSKNVDPTWVLNPSHKSKLDWDREIKDENLNKSEDLIKVEDNLEDEHSYLAMIGFNPLVHASFAAARFLVSGKPLTLSEARQALYDQDNDYVDAALQAYHLPLTDESRASIKSAMQLADFQHEPSEQAIPKGNQIEGTGPDSKMAAEVVERMFKAGEVRAAHLNGKHSKHSLIAKDSENHTLYLLKPGSGGQSPASGANQDKASQSRRESAFSRIAEVWGLGSTVPRADNVTVDGLEYAVIEMVPFNWTNLEKKANGNTGLVQKVLSPYRDRGILHKWAVLDMVLGNADRHGQNLLIDPDNKQVALIDHGSAFAGDQFNPAYDRNSFVPYYLRAWSHGKFNSLTAAQKLKQMPMANPGVKEELSDWLNNIHADRLESILHRFGIDPRACLARLAKLKTLAVEHSVDEAVCLMWVSK